MAMDRLFQLMKEKEASDMFFAVNSPVHVKTHASEPRGDVGPPCGWRTSGAEGRGG